MDTAYRMGRSQRWLMCACALTACAAAGAVAATITVSKDGRGQYRTVQAAVNAARPGDIVRILDAAVYEEQVNIDSSRSGITLTSANPLSLNKPVIRWQDRVNVGPRTCAEAQIDANVTFDRNGALRLLRVRNVVIDGIAIDGGGAYPFAYPNVWREGPDCSSRTHPLFHGNAAITLWICGDIQIRNCDIRNAYFGINVKDRNQGGIFANANPADVEPWNVVPLSGFGKTGNHLFEYNRIHHNTWGMFFESTWDLGSTIRYNLFFENHHTDDARAAAVKAMPDGEHQPGGAIFFKDHMLSPLAIHNNTFWHNFLLFAGHWRAGSQHLIFNNIYAAPHRYWGSDPNFQNPYHKLDHAFRYRMKNCVYAAQSQAPSQYYVAIMNDLQLAPTGGPVAQGTLITTPFPAAAEIRWLETRFRSTDPASADFLVPDWDDTLVQRFIIDKGYPAAGITDPDGSPADLGAVSSGGGRSPALAIVKPIAPVVINGTNATMTFSLSVSGGAFASPSVAYIRFIKNVVFQANAFGGNVAPIPESEILTVALPPGLTIRPGSNSLTVPVPPRQPTEYYAFFELILRATGSDGTPVASTVGFMPYRKMGYDLRVTVFDLAGSDTLTEVRAGEPVRIKVDAVRADGTPFVNEIRPVDIRLNSGAALTDPSGAPVTITSIQISTTKVGVFTVVPAAGMEYVMVSGIWTDPGAGNSIAFYGVSNGIRVLPGPPAVVRFQDPPSVTSGITNPPVLDPGTAYRGSLQVYDRWGNRVNAAVAVALSSDRPDWADITGARTITTDTTGRGAFLVSVVNGPPDSVFTLHAEVSPTITDDARMKIGWPLDQLWLFYADVGAYAPGTELRGRTGERLPVTIWASVDGTAPIATRSNLVSVQALASAPSLRFYAAESGGEPITAVRLRGGTALVWVTSATPVSDGCIQVYDNSDNTLVAGDKSTRCGIFFRPEVLRIDSAFCYARAGRGAVDSIDIYMGNALPYRPDSIVVHWPNRQVAPRVVRTGDAHLVVSPDSHRITVTLAQPFPEGITSGNGPNGAGFGVSWNRPAPDAGAVETPFYIQDRVGPQLRDTVWVNERFVPGNDTMTVTFSERIDSTTLAGAAFLLIKSGVGTPIPLTVLGVTQGGAWITVSFAAADLGPDAPAEGDSLRINPAGGIRDASPSRNPAHARNPAVPIMLRRRPAPVLHAYYTDRDADGTVDSVFITFARAVDPAAISLIEVVFAGDTVSLLRSMISARGAVVRGSIENLLPPHGRVTTGGPMLVTVTYRDYLEVFGCSAADSAAPVLRSALYAPVPAGATGRDSLIVTWSESVAPVASDHPVLLWNVALGRYTMTLQRTGTGSDTFLVVAIDSMLSFPVSGDSVNVNPAAEVNDGRVAQTNPSNRRVPLTIKPRQYTIALQVRVGPNPFNPSRDRITIGTATYTGTVIEIRPGADFTQIDDPPPVEGSVWIYDALGTLVASCVDGRGSNVEFVRPDRSGTVYFVWNGRNHQGRLVGAGTYVAQVRVNAGDRAERTLRTPIGVLQ